MRLDSSREIKSPCRGFLCFIASKNSSVRHFVRFYRRGIVTLTQHLQEQSVVNEEGAMKDVAWVEEEGGRERATCSVLVNTEMADLVPLKYWLSRDLRKSITSIHKLVLFSFFSFFFWYFMIEYWLYHIGLYFFSPTLSFNCFSRQLQNAFAVLINWIWCVSL